MTPDAVALLKDAIALNVESWLPKARANPTAKECLVRFLQRPDVLSHQVWKETFKAWPPRGVVARMARRLEISLHTQADFYNFRTLKDFRQEIKRIRRWYRQGRREVRTRRYKCRRIVRLRAYTAQKQMKRQSAMKRSIMNAKVELHYKRLLSPLRLQGLWRWRRTALAMRQAKLRMHSGTVAVERLWATAQAMFPPQTTGMSEDWFVFLSRLAFLRINFVHFNGPSLPGWAQHDALSKKIRMPCCKLRCLCMRVESDRCNSWKS